MDSLASSVGSKTFHPNMHLNDPLSKLKTYGFALAIIVGIGGLVVAGAGLAGYFQVGALSTLSQVHALIMMTVGCGSGIFLLIFGVVGLVKNHQQSRALKHDKSTHRSNQTSNERSIDVQDGLIYGPAAWQIWGVEVLDAVPEVPVIDWDKNDPFFHEAYRKNYALLYIPHRIIGIIKEKEMDLNLHNFTGMFNYVNKDVDEQFGNNTPSGWVLMSKKVIPESRNKSYEIQKNMVEKEKGFRMPYVLEAVVFKLMRLCDKGEKDEERDIYTRCIEKVDGGYHSLVGGFGSYDLFVIDHTFGGFNCDVYGVAALQKF